RDLTQIEAYRNVVANQLADFRNTVSAVGRTELSLVYRLRDMLLSQHAYLTAMIDYSNHGGKSRGSALYTDTVAGQKAFAHLPNSFTFSLEDEEHPLIQELWYENGLCKTAWRTPRPIPEDDDFFENVWRRYRENRCIE
ncbi:MAG: oxidoreductase, partial [Christensenella sp.]